MPSWPRHVSLESRILWVFLSSTEDLWASTRPPKERRNRVEIYLALRSSFHRRDAPFWNRQTSVPRPRPVSSAHLASLAEVDPKLQVDGEKNRNKNVQKRLSLVEITPDIFQSESSSVSRTIAIDREMSAILMPDVTILSSGDTIVCCPLARIFFDTLVFPLTFSNVRWLPQTSLGNVLVPVLATVRTLSNHKFFSDESRDRDCELTSRLNFRVTGNLNVFVWFEMFMGWTFVEKNDTSMNADDPGDHLSKIAPSLAFVLWERYDDVVPSSFRRWLLLLQEEHRALRKIERKVTRQDFLWGHVRGTAH